MVAPIEAPTMLYSSRADVCELTPEQCEFRSQHWHYWYQADNVYALGTVYLFVATIGVCLIGFWALKAAPNSLKTSTWWQKIVACFRFLAYRHYDVEALGSRTSPLGVIFLLLVGGVFFLAMTLGPKPYYWPNTRTLNYGSSPPLATRAGWMALACLPFMLILATKANIIAAITGVSHERLMIFHTWVGWAMFTLALIHTFPFIVYHEWKGDMVTEWETDPEYWTGVAALIPQFYLQVMSFPFIRNRFYEFFKATHYIAAILFVVFFFLHCDFTLTSLNYFIASGVLYTLSWLYTQVKTYFQFGVALKATIEMVSESSLRITIPIKAKWRPAQHVFLRFITPNVHSLTAHPFTICSVPNAGKGSDQTKMVFYIQPRGGTTSWLAKMAVKQPAYTIPVLVDGPYGGVKGQPLHLYDRSLVIACGSGAALSLGPAMDTILRCAGQKEGTAEGARRLPHRMHIIMATRDGRFLEWYEDALLSFMADTGTTWPVDELGITVYKTGSHSGSTGSVNDVENQYAQKHTASVEKPAYLPITTYDGRPDISALLKQETLLPDVSVAVAVCGPSGVIKEVQNETAAAQLRVLGNCSGAREVYLHSELFSW